MKIISILLTTTEWIHFTGGGRTHVGAFAMYRQPYGFAPFSLLLRVVVLVDWLMYLDSLGEATGNWQRTKLYIVHVAVAGENFTIWILKEQVGITTTLGIYCPMMLACFAWIVQTLMMCLFLGLALFHAWVDLLLRHFSSQCQMRLMRSMSNEETTNDLCKDARAQTMWFAVCTAFALQRIHFFTCIMCCIPVYICNIYVYIH